MARNEWFQLHALDALRKFRASHPAERCTVFAFSYAAEHLLRFAKDCGWQTVLGQIDPGPFEEKLVTELHREAGLPCSNAAPARYWEGWRRECVLADRILVNSDWSRHGLLAEGIADSKIAVVPLAYPPQPAAAAFVRTYPAAFNAERPLRILFLGQVNLRKGLAAILEVIPVLKGLPVEFWMVGDIQIPLPEALREHPQVKWTGAVPRSATARIAPGRRRGRLRPAARPGAADPGLRRARREGAAGRARVRPGPRGSGSATSPWPPRSSSRACWRWPRRSSAARSGGAARRAATTSRRSASGSTSTRRSTTPIRSSTPTRRSPTSARSSAG